MYLFKIAKEMLNGFIACMLQARYQDPSSRLL